MTKLLSLLLSFSILFTTVAPSYAQALDAVRAQKTPYEQMKAGFGIGGNTEGRTDAFTEAMERAAEQIYAEEGQMRVAWEGIKGEYKGWAGSEYKAKDLLVECEKEVSKALQESKGAPDQARVCHEGTCHNAVIYGRACARGVLNFVWDGKSEAPVSAYRWGMEKKGYTGALASLVSLVGASAADKEKTFRYFTGVLKKDGICEKADKTGTKDSDNRLPRESECEAALRGLDALVVLANIYPDLKGKTADAVYGFMKDKRRGDLGAGAVYQGALSLMGLDTDYSYGLLKRFLLEDSRPTYAGTALDKLGYLTLEGITSAVQEGKADTAGRYLNGYTARFNYLDEDLGRKWIGPGNTCEIYAAAVPDVRNNYQCPEGNLYEDIGMVLVRDIKNGRSVKLVKEIWESSAQENVLGRYPAPLLTGILVGDQGAWTYKYGGARAQAVLKGLLRVDFTDMNEGTQRRLKVMAAEAVAAHEAFKPVKTQADEIYEKRHNVSMVYQDDRVSRYEKRDQAKFERYKTQQWHRSVFGMLDLAVLVVVMPKLLTSLGIYGARGAYAFSKVAGLRKMAALSAHTFRRLEAMNVRVLAEGSGAGQKAASAAAQHPNVARAMSGAERVARVQQVAGRAAGEIKFVDFDVSRLTVGLGEATVSSTNKLPQAAKAAEAAGVKLSGPAVAMERLPVTHRLGNTVNALGQTVKGYLPVNPAAPLAKPSFGKTLWGNVLEWGGSAKYEAGQIFSGVGHAMRSKTAALALWMSVNMSPAASVVESTVRLANPVKTELVVMNAASQGATAAASTVRTASVMRAGMQLSTNAVKAASAAPKAGNLLSHVLFVPAVATPETVRQFGRFYDSKQSQPGAGFVERFLPQLVKEAAIDYQKQLGAYEAQQRQLQMQSQAFLSSAHNLPSSQMSLALADGAASSAASNSSTSGYLYSGLPIGVIGKIYRNIADGYARSSADRSARSVLKRTQPLPTELRNILQGKASEDLKKQALLRLHTQFNIFAQTIQTLPAETQEKIKKNEKDPHAKEMPAETQRRENALAQSLYNLFNAAVFAQPLKHLSNHIPVEQFAKKLEKIISSEAFLDVSQQIYEDTPVLSAESNLFTGVTEGLKDVDEAAVLAATRPEGWAAINASDGKEVRGGWIRYKNDVPVYYRNASGEVSKTPIIILHQEQPSWYASMLGALRLSTRRGLKVPKGMVLAIDENGKFKYTSLPGHLHELNSSKIGIKSLNKVYNGGSLPAEVDTPYTISDLLAIAKMSVQNPDLNFQLTLTKPNSFKLFVNFLGAFFGLNVDGVMVGPFKDAAKSVETELVRTGAPTAFGGVGYVTPRVAGAMVPYMQNWGLNKATFAILAVSLATLGTSMAFGINGLHKTDCFNLFWLAAPMAVLVLAASLLRSAAPLLLNHYKDPRMRTAANLKMSSWQQGSRFALAVVTGGLNSWAGINEFVTIPVAMLLAGLTLSLFLNTTLWESMRKNYKSGVANVPAQEAKQDIPPAAQNKVSYKEKLKASGKFLTTLGGSIVEGIFEPVVWAVRKIFPKKVTYSDDADGRYQKAYDEEFAKDAETKGALTRVTLAYGSYAASTLLLSQLGKVVLGGPSNILVGGFMLASWLVRFFASKWVASGKYSDDQLTGVSFQGLAVMPMGLALMSAGLAFTGWSWWYLAALIPLGIGLNMSTAVPGQLDNTRLQNNVTAAMQKRKNAVLQDSSLSPEQKKSRIDELVNMEKYWTSQASKSYSNANANGIRGIYVALLAGLLPIDWYWVAAIVFAVSGAVAAAGVVKTSEMGKSFWNAFLGSKFKITDEDIAQGRVSAKTFEIKNEDKARLLVASLVSGKEGSIKTLRSDLAPHSTVTVASEIKMTKIMTRMIQIHNRLVAAAEVVSAAEIRPAFESFYSLVKDYEQVLNRSHLSESLNRQFAKLTAGLCKDGVLENGLTEHPGYIVEGEFKLLENHTFLLRAQDLITEMRVLARNMERGGNAVNPNTYRLFLNYHDRAENYLQEYLQTNRSESAQVKQARGRITRTCRDLKASNLKDPLRGKAGPTPEEDIQLVEDLLQAY